MAARRSFGSVRARATAGAVAVVGVAFVVAGIALVTVMQRTMQDNVRDAARLVAEDLAARLEASAPQELPLPRDDDVIVQITDGDGVLASSERVAGKPALAALGPGESAIVRHSDVDDDPFVYVAALAGDGTVIVGRNLDLVVDALATARTALLVALPLLLLLVGWTTWRVVGRSLAPVEAIRAQVAEMSAKDLHRRVPQPGTGDEIGRLATTMNEMLARLEHARTSQQRLVSDASHELRGPIAAIRHHAEVALAHPGSTDVNRLAADVAGETNRLETLSEDLLTLAKADEDGLSLALKPLDLDDIVLEEARRARSTAALTVDTSDVSGGRVAGDGAALHRLVRNLADNATRHARSRVRFALGEAGDDVVLEVDDDGPGVPPEARAVVFQRFTRLDSDRSRAGGGAGLGLAIVAEIASAHGGTASVDDAPSGGARFRVVLPRVR